MILSDATNMLLNCRCCPRKCCVNRTAGQTGYCASGADIWLSSVCTHTGEEPVISGQKGICNVFFARCNLQCIYCQNYAISRNNGKVKGRYYTSSEAVDVVCRVLDESENIVGFVSPSHQIPQMVAMIEAVKKTGRTPVIVYNSNGYDDVDSLKMLEGIVDVYLPDFKYADATLSSRFSGAGDYPMVASKAIQEMYRQKGASLIVDERGVAMSGLIIRHLLLPGCVDNSVKVLEVLANAISTDVHVSLMAQYYPSADAIGDPELGRNVTHTEYTQLVDAFYRLGFHKGWIQELESHESYRPDFSQSKPFQRG